MPSERERNAEPAPRALARRRRRWHRRWPSALALGALGLTIVVAPQLLGGAHDWGTAIISVLAFLSVATATLLAWRSGTDPPLPALLGLAAFLTLWTVLQAVPLPCGLVEVLVPDAAEAQRLSDRAPRRDA